MQTTKEDVRNIYCAFIKFWETLLNKVLKVNQMSLL